MLGVVGEEVEQYSGSRMQGEERTGGVKVMGEGVCNIGLGLIGHCKDLLFAQNERGSHWTSDKIIISI